MVCWQGSLSARACRGSASTAPQCIVGPGRGPPRAAAGHFAQWAVFAAAVFLSHLGRHPAWMPQLTDDCLSGLSIRSSTCKVCAACLCWCSCSAAGRRTSTWACSAQRWRQPKHTMPQRSSTVFRQGQSISPRGPWQVLAVERWDPPGGQAGLPGEDPGGPGGVAGGGAEGCLEGGVSAPFRCADQPSARGHDSLQAGEQGTQNRVPGARVAQHSAVYVCMLD